MIASPVWCYMSHDLHATTHLRHRGRLQRTRVLLSLAATVVLVSGCTTYPGATVTYTVSYEGVQDDATFSSREEAQEAATTLSRRLNNWQSDDDQIVLTNVDFVPVSQTGLIPMVITHWSLGLRVELEIPEGTGPGKRTFPMEAVDEAGEIAASGQIPLNIRGSEAEATLINGVVLLVFGWLCLGMGLSPYTTNRMLERMGAEAQEPEPEAGCLGLILVPAGALMLLAGLWNIGRALFL